MSYNIHQKHNKILKNNSTELRTEFLWTILILSVIIKMTQKAEEMLVHFVKAKGILSSQNGMNIYRGCSHECIYCDSRSKCYRINHKFEDIEVKENALELLKDALRRKRKKCMIGTGSMSDPYIPLELKLEYTRKALLLIEEYGFGIALQTKSDRVLRDLDILKRINEKAKAVVQITLTTADEKLCKIIEPEVCTTEKRFEVLKTLRDNGIPTVVWLCPVLPYINDTRENIESILKQNGVTYCEIDEKYQNENKEARIIDQSHNILKRIVFPLKENTPIQSDMGEFMNTLTTYNSKGRNEHDDAPDSLGLATSQFIEEKSQGGKVIPLKRIF